MNRTVQECSNDLVAALKAIPGLRASVIDGVAINPPHAVVGPPTVTYEGFCGGDILSTLTFHINLVAKSDALSTERLYTFLPLIAAAVNGVKGAVVIQATPGTYGGTGDGFPAYNIELEMSP